MTSQNDLQARRSAPLRTPSDILPESIKEIAGALNKLLADVFALYLKTKNFHWHMSGPHFRDYHLLLDDQGDQIFAMTDEIAERARKMRDAGVDRNHEVELLDQRGGVGEILKLGRRVQDAAELAQRNEVAVASILLQADELRSGVE